VIGHDANILVRSLSQDEPKQAARLFATGNADFADCLIERAGHANACEHTLTFDRLAVNGAGMRLLGRNP
jgi:predicted nucleic-acid-binding protein